MKVEEFEAELLRLNNGGNDATLKHREMYPFDKKEEKGGRRYHAPATKKDCTYCKTIIKFHDDYMDLQKKHFELTGIPFENMIAAIRVTKGVLKMMKESGEL